MAQRTNTQTMSSCPQTHDLTQTENCSPSRGILKYVLLHQTLTSPGRKLEQHVLESDQMNKWPCESTTQPVESDHMPSDQPPLAFESGVDGKSLCAHIEQNFNLADTVCKYYHEDPTFAKVLAHPKAHPCFGIKDGLIWTKNQMKKNMVCLPWKAFLWGRRLVKVIMDHAHTTIGHFGQLGTSCYISHHY